jgi:hypothetical protein
VTWHRVTVGQEDLSQFLTKVRREGARVTHCFPCADGFCVMYTSVGELDVVSAC